MEALKGKKIAGITNLHRKPYTQIGIRKVSGITMGSAISTEFGLSSPPVATKTKEATIEEMKQKALEIEECLSNDPVNLWHLRELALTRGGLLESTFVSIVL